MLSLDTMATFLAASILLGLAPGPDNLFVMSQSALYGRMSGMIVLAGLCTGLVVHTAAVALGVAVIFQSSAVAFTVLKIAGAAYLAVLAWQAFRSRGADLAIAATGTTSCRHLYLRGILMNITNPKVSLFFLAFLPQFAEPGRGPVIIQLALLGGLFIVATLVVFGGMVFLAGGLGELLKRSPRLRQLLGKATGVIFLGLALKLAVAER